MKHRVYSATLVFTLLSSATFLLAFAPIKEAGKQAQESVLKESALQKIKNWGIFNAAAAAKALPSHIFAPSAWKIAAGSRDIVVAVIDTGIDPVHPDLQRNVWKERVSQAYGWNFVNNQPNPRDEHGHGTHVAGIIGATTNPESGVSGVAPNVSILSVKYYSEGASGAVNLRNTVRAIRYAIEKGARIINYSGGGPEFSQEEYDAIREAHARGILFVAAAGNERQDTDRPEGAYYPAGYRLPNMITVAATDIRNKLLSSSNWGLRSVDVAAPGENIYSTLPSGRYGYMSGTSQATAFVTGLAALLLSKNPSLKPEDLRKLIIQTVDPVSDLQGRVLSGGKINAYAALLTATRPGLRLRDANDTLVLTRRPVSLLDEGLLSAPASR